MANDRYPAANNRNGSSVWSMLTDFSYSPSSPESWVRLGCQVCVGGMAIIFLKALDGNVCGQPWTVALPQTWGNPVGCFIRSLVQNVPDNFLGTSIQQQPEQLIQPPIQQQGIQQQNGQQQPFNQNQGQPVQPQNFGQSNAP